MKTDKTQRNLRLWASNQNGAPCAHSSSTYTKKMLPVSVPESSHEECDQAGEFPGLTARLGSAHFSTLSLGLHPMVLQTPFLKGVVELRSQILPNCPLHPSPKHMSEVHAPSQYLSSWKEKKKKKKSPLYTLSCALTHLRSSLTQILIQQVWGGAWDSAFLRSAWVMLVLLVALSKTTDQWVDLKLDCILESPEEFLTSFPKNGVVLRKLHRWFWCAATLATH